ncbi:3-isopropylmalate/(R)-2-methylmalate dehydratase large subunit [Desulfotomaculum arcticum]|uniref:3-isopropylmalate/(R)-2-methylmalate dehydratase large subunit n=1 Tax=Desulfotruncus arcticus DSM 17038 TaxID=1121424 RepID=A0A1I2PF64_9FIRM|nr:aconitase/3-isopropylmalate dehydratase large subunit family protein [Desulfotruncus arcticus]SFG14785.1 3-isopropylmalate/(R)-2-methylmalate dehydratase large subunit [Desulfotomaculum arcticum] [Desulfotruncus arcticus DSM 17038]
MKPMTIVEKILSRKAGAPVYAGDFATVPVDALMIHDSNAATTMESFRSFKRNGIMPGTDVVMVMDHFAPCPTEAAANMHLKMREFAAGHNLRLYGEGDGVGHQIMCEGHVFPGDIAVGTDSHSCTYGALNALGTGIGSTEAAGVLAYRRMWFRVPESIRVVWHGELPAGVTAKDLALKTVQEIGLRRAIYKVLEFAGDVVSRLPVEDRMTICNMGVEVGAKAAIMPPDDKLLQWIDRRPGTARTFEAAGADPGCAYCEVLELDAGQLEPLVACPPMVNLAAPARELSGKPVSQVVLGSCTNGRAGDFHAAAALLAGKKVAPGVRLILVPASRQVLTELINDGTMEALVRAGGQLIPPGCGPCAGYHGGIVGKQEVVVATTNRNFIGRMGSQDAEIYLASPVTAAAAALTGMITDPREVL